MKVTNDINIKLENYLNKYLNKNNIIYKKVNNTSYINNNEEEYYEDKVLYKQKEHYTGISSNSTLNINNYLNQELDKNNFQKTLFDLIDASGEKDSDIYNKAYIDRRLFSKIRNNPHYHPSKNTVISLGLALNLNINDFENLLNSASYSLPKNNYFDLIIRFCINEKIYNILDVNDYLDKYNCNTLN